VAAEEELCPNLLSFVFGVHKFTSAIETDERERERERENVSPPGRRDSECKKQKT
jgi:hypothetical protein